jgi:hypothetical protein
MYDPRWDDGRDRGGSWDRSRGRRGGTSERDWESEHDRSDVFTKDLDLPRGPDRELVHERERTYEINGAESCMLATVGAFRVVCESDLYGLPDASQDTRHSLRHLRHDGLIRTAPLAPTDRAVVLTERGRELLESNRYDRPDRAHEPGQAFYAGLRKPRELTHDAKLYRAYLLAEGRLQERGARVHRVVLDYELKREYQQFLHERNRGRKDSDGRPDREPEEIAAWARAHDLPYFDDQLHFPDVRIEYEDRDGRWRHEDIEVTTAHYRGAHAAASTRSGFTRYRGVGGLAGGRGGRRTPLPRVAEEFI